MATTSKTLKENWPIILAGGAALVALILLFRPRTTLTQQPVQVGGGQQDQGFTAALQAQTAIEQTRQQTFAGLFSSYVSGLVQREQTQTAERIASKEAQVRIRQIESEEKMQLASVEAQASAARAQIAAQQQANVFGFLGGIIGRIFCWEVTNQRRVDVAAKNARRLHRSSVDRMFSQSGVWKGTPRMRVLTQKA